MKYLISLLFCFMFIGCVFSSNIIVSAESKPAKPPTDNTHLINPLKFNDVYALVAELLKILNQLAVIACTFFIIYGGFTYVTAAGNEEKIKTAHRTLLYSVIGTGVLLGANVLASVLSNTVSQVTNIKLK